MFSNSFGQNNQGGGLFGAQQNKPQGGGLFQSFANNPAPNQNQGGLFGQNQNPNQNAGGGVFGQTNQGQTGFGTNQGFGNQQQTNSFQGNSPMFGQNQTQGGLFGQQPQQTNQSNNFGQMNQGGGLFGQPLNQQNQNTGGGIFGQNNQNQPQTNQGLFGQNQNQGGSGLFGAQNTNTNTSSGLFGAASNNNNQSFLGRQPSMAQNQGGNIFGGTNNQPQGNSNLFGAASQTQQNNLFGGQTTNQTSNLFGAPNNNNNAPGNSLFGGFGNNNNNNTSNANTSSLFGNVQQNPTTSAFNSNAGNKFGGTSWGVPTPAQPTAPGSQSFQPVRSKNSKLDGKHLVKCIAALDQFQGCSKEEIRINFIQSGGQQPSLNQQNQGIQAGSLGFAKPQNTNAPLTSLPSFGGANTSLFGQTNTGATSSLFGGQSQQAGGNSLFGTSQPQGNSLFGTQPQQQAFGQPQPQGTSLFGGQPQPQGNSLFGAQPQPQGTSLFGGQPQNQTSSVFGPVLQPTSLFGAQPQQQGTPLFGGQPQQQGTSLFGGQPQPQGTSLFGGQPQPQGNSLFGAQPQPQGNSLFGGQTQPQQQGTSLFGSCFSPLQAPPSLLSPGGVSTPTPFPQNPQPYATPLPNPFNNSQFGQLISPLFQQQQQMDPNLQLLLPQLLLSYALNQNQNGQSGAPANTSTLEMLNKLITNMSTAKPAEQNSKNTNTILNPTPFDEYLKEESNSKWSERPAQRRSLFSEAEIREFEDLDARSYMDRVYAPEKTNEESFQLKHTFKPQNRKPDPLGESNYKIINKSYRAAQEQARKKYTPTNEDLPQLGNYNISPSLEKLKNMTLLQLKKCQKVKIFNSYGSIEFLEPISLYRLDIPGSIKIAQDNVEIVDPELEEKRVRMTFNNFGNYVNAKPEERTKLLKRMRLWIEQCRMEEISHNEDNGELIVETID